VERVLVTGSGGFVGRHLQDRLQDRFVPFEGDVLDASALAASVRDARPDALVHLAALSSVGDSWGDATEVWRTNVLGTVNVLEALTAGAPEARLLFVSSGEVYGRAAIVPTPEEAPVEPVSPYGASKAAAELACRQAASGLDVVIARAFPHVGPGQNERFAVASWASQLARLHAEGGGVLRVGDLDVERDLTDVRDVCRAYESLLDRAAPAGMYNVSTGTPVPLKRVVELLVKAVAAPVKIEQDEARIRPAEVRRLAGDPSKLRAATGWTPEIPLEHTLRDVLAAARTTVETETIPSG
jgi:GDP-4-dehydro-6-deoxy-D-mannose reductase